MQWHGLSLNEHEALYQALRSWRVLCLERYGLTTAGFSELYQRHQFARRGGI